MNSLSTQIVKSWLTTIGGVLALLTALFNAIAPWLDSDPTTVVNWNIVATAAAAAWVGIFAKPLNRSTEDIVGKSPQAKL